MNFRIPAALDRGAPGFTPARHDAAAAPRGALFGAVTGHPGEFSTPEDQQRGRTALVEALGAQDNPQAQARIDRLLRTPGGIQRLEQDLIKRYRDAGVTVPTDPQTRRPNFDEARKQLDAKLREKLPSDQDPTKMGLGEALKTGIAQHQEAQRQGSDPARRPATGRDTRARPDTPAGETGVRAGGRQRMTRAQRLAAERIAASRRAAAAQPISAEDRQWGESVTTRWTGSARQSVAERHALLATMDTELAARGPNALRAVNPATLTAITAWRRANPAPVVVPER